MSDVSTPNTVEVNGFEITSTESADEMLRVLKPAEGEKSKEPRVIKPILDKPVEAKEAKPDAKLSKAAARLGQAGGKAAAEARRAATATGVDAEAGSRSSSAAPEEDGDSVGGADAETERPLGKPESDPYARVRQLAARESQIRRERDQAIAELQRLRQEREQQAPPQQQARPVPQQGQEQPPNPADFEDWNEYIRADARFAARQEFLQAQREVEAQREVQEFEHFITQAQSDFVGRVRQAYARENPPQIAEHILGLKTSLARQQNEPATAEHVIADAIYLAPNGIELMEYLSEHEDAFDYLTQLPSPEIIQWEMRRISDLLSERPEPGRATVAGSKVQSVSRAYPPVKTVTGSPTAADPNELSDDLPFEEYAKRRNAQEARKARR